MSGLFIAYRLLFIMFNYLDGVRGGLLSENTMLPIEEVVSEPQEHVFN